MEAPIYQKVSGFERGVITVIVMVGAFMAILDTTIVDIIVPKITAPLQTDFYGVQWVITAYMMASATMLILAEWLDKNFGLKKIYILGVAVFTLASFWCGVSSSLEEMITARALQGVGEAFIMATSQTILFSVYPPEKKGIAMGIFGLGVSFAPSIGPTLGGYITEFRLEMGIFYKYTFWSFNCNICNFFLTRNVSKKGKRKFKLCFLWIAFCVYYFYIDTFIKRTTIWLV